MTRTSLIAILISILSLPALGQYIPNNSQAFQFASLYNPGFTGVERFGDLKLSYRYQWTGFGPNAPKFVNLSFNMRLKNPVDLAYNAMRTSNPNMMRAQNMPAGKKIIHGFGTNVFQWGDGIIEAYGAGVS